LKLICKLKNVETLKRL